MLKEHFKALKPGTLLEGVLWQNRSSGKHQVEIAEGPKGSPVFLDNYVLVWGPKGLMVPTDEPTKPDRIKELQHNKHWLSCEEATLISGEW